MTAPKIRRRQQVGAVYITAPEVMDRYGVSHMWLVRRLTTDPDFPKPTYIGRMRFFKIKELEEYERKCALRVRPKNKSKKESAHAAA
jgi:predicted DNA-binding transcriptional regulator AlpA